MTENMTIAQHLQGESHDALLELDNLSRKAKGDMALAADIVDVIGVLAGIKPAAFIGGNELVVGNDLLSRLGLVCATSKIKNIVYVSFDKEKAERLASLHELVWGKNAEYANENREIGRLLGYPVTATEYFLHRLSVYGTTEELPIVRVKRTKDTVSEHFQSLILSPEHYDQELAAYSEPLEKATRLLAPRTYAMIKRAATKERFKKHFDRLISRDAADDGLVIREV